MSLLEISVGLVMVSILSVGIVMKYTGRIDEERFAAKLESRFSETPKERCEIDGDGWQHPCYLKGSGIVVVKYALSSDSTERDQAFKFLIRIGGRYDDDGAVIFSRTVAPRHTVRNRAFRRLLDEGL